MLTETIDTLLEEAREEQRKVQILLGRVHKKAEGYERRLTMLESTIEWLSRRAQVSGETDVEDDHEEHLDEPVPPMVATEPIRQSGPTGFACGGLQVDWATTTKFDFPRIALRHVGRPLQASDIVQMMKDTGYGVHENTRNDIFMYLRRNIGKGFHKEKTAHGTYWRLDGMPPMNGTGQDSNTDGE